MLFYREGVEAFLQQPVAQTLWLTLWLVHEQMLKGPSRPLGVAGELEVGVVDVEPGEASAEGEEDAKFA